MATAMDALFDTLEKEKAAPARAATYKNLLHLNTTTKQQDFQPTAEKARLCAACGLPMVGDMYELADGRLIHHSDECLLEAAGIYACADSLYSLAEREAIAAAWYRAHGYSDQGVALC